MQHLFRSRRSSQAAGVVVAVDHQDNDQKILADLTMPDAYSAIVLAGGMSSRMGDTNKL